MPKRKKLTGRERDSMAHELAQTARQIQGIPNLPPDKQQDAVDAATVGLMEAIIKLLGKGTIPFALLVFVALGVFLWLG